MQRLICALWGGLFGGISGGISGVIGSDILLGIGSGAIAGGIVGLIFSMPVENTPLLAAVSFRSEAIMGGIVSTTVLYEIGKFSYEFGYIVVFLGSGLGTVAMQIISSIILGKDMFAQRVLIGFVGAPIISISSTILGIVMLIASIWNLTWGLYYLALFLILIYLVISFIHFKRRVTIPPDELSLSASEVFIKYVIFYAFPYTCKDIASASSIHQFLAVGICLIATYQISLLFLLVGVFFWYAFAYASHTINPLYWLHISGRQYDHEEIIEYISNSMADLDRVAFRRLMDSFVDSK